MLILEAKGDFGGSVEVVCAVPPPTNRFVAWTVGGVAADVAPPPTNLLEETTVGGVVAALPPPLPPTNRLAVSTLGLAVVGGVEVGTAVGLAGCAAETVSLAAVAGLLAGAEGVGGLVTVTGAVGEGEGFVAVLVGFVAVAAEAGGVEGFAGDATTAGGVEGFAGDVTTAGGVEGFAGDVITAGGVDGFDAGVAVGTAAGGVGLAAEEVGAVVGRPPATKRL